MANFGESVYTRKESADVSVMSLYLTVTTFNCKSINEASKKHRTPHATVTVVQKHFAIAGAEG